MAKKQTNNKNSRQRNESQARNCRTSSQSMEASRDLVDTNETYESQNRRQIRSNRSRSSK